MKNIILALVLCFMIQGIVSADVYVFSYVDSKEVIFISEQDNVVIAEGETNIEKTILPNDIAFYDLTEQYSDYKLSGNKFILNTKKISDREDKKNEDKDKENKKNADFITAKTKLMSSTWEALTSDEVDSLR